jgi:hypothetical protein
MIDWNICNANRAMISSAIPAHAGKNLATKRATRTPTQNA